MTENMIPLRKRDKGEALAYFEGRLVALQQLEERTAKDLEMVRGLIEATNVAMRVVEETY